MRGHHDLIRPRRLWNTNWIMWTRCKLRTCDLIAWPSLGLQPYQFWSQHFSFLHPRTDFWHLLRSFLFEKHWFLAPHSPDPLPPPIPPHPPSQKNLLDLIGKSDSVWIATSHTSVLGCDVCMYLCMYVWNCLYVSHVCIPCMYCMHVCVMQIFQIKFLRLPIVICWKGLGLELHTRQELFSSTRWLRFWHSFVLKPAQTMSFQIYFL